MAQRVAEGPLVSRILRRSGSYRCAKRQAIVENGCANLQLVLNTIVADMHHSYFLSCHLNLDAPEQARSLIGDVEGSWRIALAHLGNS